MGEEAAAEIRSTPTSQTVKEQQREHGKNSHRRLRCEYMVKGVSYLHVFIFSRTVNLSVTVKVDLVLIAKRKRRDRIINVL